jgi:hypothetical protein
VDADRLTFACATAAEAAAARRAGLRAVRVGIGAANGLPEGELVSFGIAGGLDGSAASGTVIDATRVVDEAGSVLWEGPQLGVHGAVPGTILAASRIVDSASGRAALHASTGAVAADLESGPIARSGRLSGCLRVVADTPGRPLAGLESAARPDGRTSPLGLVRAFVRRPVAATRAARDAMRALSKLEAVAR